MRSKLIYIVTVTLLAASCLNAKSETKSDTVTSKSKESNPAMFDQKKKQIKQLLRQEYADIMFEDTGRKLTFRASSHGGIAGQVILAPRVHSARHLPAVQKDDESVTYENNVPTGQSQHFELFLKYRSAISDLPDRIEKILKG